MLLGTGGWFIWNLIWQHVTYNQINIKINLLSRWMTQVLSLSDCLGVNQEPPLEREGAATQYNISRGVLPSKRLLGMCRWMGSHFHNLTDYNGVTFLVELLEWGRKFSGFLGCENSGKHGFKNRKIRSWKMVPAVVLIFNSRLTLYSVLKSQWHLPKSDWDGVYIWPQNRIEYNGVAVLRGQRHIPSKTWPKYPPPPGWYSFPNFDFVMLCFLSQYYLYS